jgi:hypothetical protein
MGGALIEGRESLEAYRVEQLLKAAVRPRRTGPVKPNKATTSKARVAASPKAPSKPRASAASKYYQPLEAMRRGDIVAPPVMWKLRWRGSRSRNGRVKSIREILAG